MVARKWDPIVRITKKRWKGRSNKGESQARSGRACGRAVAAAFSLIHSDVLLAASHSSMRSLFGLSVSLPPPILHSFPFPSPLSSFLFLVLTSFVLTLTFFPFLIFPSYFSLFFFLSSSLHPPSLSQYTQTHGLLLVDLTTISLSFARKIKMSFHVFIFAIYVALSWHLFPCALFVASSMKGGH